MVCDKGQHVIINRNQKDTVMLGVDREQRKESSKEFRTVQMAQDSCRI